MSVSSPPALSSLWERYWLVVCGLLPIVASEYKWRLREVGSSLSGRPDLATLVEVGLYGILALLLLQWRSPTPRWGRTQPVMAWMLGYSAYACAAFAWSPYLSTAAVRAAELALVLLLCWTAYRTGTRAHYIRFCHGFVVLTTASIVLGVILPLPQPKTQVGRFTWLLVHQTSSAVFLGISAVLLTVYLVQPRRVGDVVRWSPPAYVVLLVVHLAALYYNHTRGAAIALLVAWIVLAFLLRPNRRRVSAVILVGWVAVVTPLAASGALVSFIERGSSLEKLSTLNERTNLWAVALQSVGKEPLYGSGLYASRGIFYDSTGLGGGHNAVVNVLVDLGVVGLVLWLGLLISFVVTLLRARRATPPTAPEDTDLLIMLCVTVFLMIDGLTVAGMGGVANVSAMWLFLLVAWAGRTRRAQAASLTSRQTPTKAMR